MPRRDRDEIWSPRRAPLAPAPALAGGLHKHRGPNFISFTLAAWPEGTNYKGNHRLGIDVVVAVVVVVVVVVAGGGGLVHFDSAGATKSTDPKATTRPNLGPAAGGPQIRRRKRVNLAASRCNQDDEAGSKGRPAARYKLAALGERLSFDWAPLAIATSSGLTGSGADTPNQWARPCSRRECGGLSGCWAGS